MFVDEGLTWPSEAGGPHEEEDGGDRNPEEAEKHQARVQASFRQVRLSSAIL